MSSRPNTGPASRADVKALTHWIIRQGYTVRFTARRPDQVAGILRTPEGPVEFTYDPAKRVVHLPDRSVPINAYGWETDPTHNEFGSVTFDAPPTDRSQSGKSPLGAAWLGKLRAGQPAPRDRSSDQSPDNSPDQSSADDCT